MDTAKIIQFLGTDIKYSKDRIQIVNGNSKNNSICDMCYDDIFDSISDFDKELTIDSYEFLNGIGQFVADAIKEKVEREKDKIFISGKTETIPKQVDYFTAQITAKFVVNKQNAEGAMQLETKMAGKQEFLEQYEIKDFQDWDGHAISLKEAL